MNDDFRRRCAHVYCDAIIWLHIVDVGVGFGLGSVRGGRFLRTVCSRLRHRKSLALRPLHHCVVGALQLTEDHSTNT
jgi:hypothetical protein